MPREIALTQGKVAIVDDEDYPAITALGSWCFNCGYAVRAGGVRMHRVVVGAPHGMQVDHVNGDTLDNRRSNLRLCDSAGNQANRKRVRGVPKFKGVGWQRRKSGTGFWKAAIVHLGRTYYLGAYSTDIEAAAAYNAKAVELFGEFAHLNDLSLPADPRVSDTRPAQIARRGSSSQYKGVTYDRARGTWMAQLKHRGDVVLKRRFPTEHEAAKAYDDAARAAFGDAAITNFMEKQQCLTSQM